MESEGESSRERKRVLEELVASESSGDHQTSSQQPSSTQENGGLGAPGQQQQQAANTTQQGNDGHQQQQSRIVIGPDPQRFYCPHPGCKRSFAELWRLKVHYRAPPNVRGSGMERGHGTELEWCPKCGKDLIPGQHHVARSGSGTPTGGSASDLQGIASGSFALAGPPGESLSGLGLGGLPGAGSMPLPPPWQQLPPQPPQQALQYHQQQQQHQQQHIPAQLQHAQQHQQHLSAQLQHAHQHLPGQLQHTQQQQQQHLSAQLQHVQQLPLPPQALPASPTHGQLSIASAAQHLSQHLPPRHLPQLCLDPPYPAQFPGQYPGTVPGPGAGLPGGGLY